MPFAIESADNTLFNLHAAGAHAQAVSMQDALSHSAQQVDASKAKIEDVGAFKREFPDLYDKFMLMWADQMRREEQRRNDRIIAELKKLK